MRLGVIADHSIPVRPGLGGDELRGTCCTSRPITKNVAVAWIRLSIAQDLWREGARGRRRRSARPRADAASLGRCRRWRKGCADSSRAQRRTALRGSWAQGAEVGRHLCAYRLAACSKLDDAGASRRPRARDPVQARAPPTPTRAIASRCRRRREGPRRRGRRSAEGLRRVRSSLGGWLIADRFCRHRRSCETLLVPVACGPMFAGALRDLVIRGQPYPALPVPAPQRSLRTQQRCPPGVVEET